MMPNHQCEQYARELARELNELRMKAGACPLKMLFTPITLLDLFTRTGAPYRAQFLPWAVARGMLRKTESGYYSITTTDPIHWAMLMHFFDEVYSERQLRNSTYRAKVKAKGSKAMHEFDSLPNYTDKELVMALRRRGYTVLCTDGTCI